jgi:hypothetical protein
MPYAHMLLCAFYLARSIRIEKIMTADYQINTTMIIKYWGKIRLSFPNDNLWPFTSRWLEDQYANHMSLERTYYFYDHIPTDPICLQYYGKKFKEYGYAPWVIHPGINRSIVLALKGDDSWLRCVICSEVDLSTEIIPEWLQLGSIISMEPNLNLSTLDNNWHNIKYYITSETSRDALPGSNHWIDEAHFYTKGILKNNKIILETGSGTIIMNGEGTVVKEYSTTTPNFFNTVKTIFQDIKLWSKEKNQ